MFILSRQTPQCKESLKYVELLKLDNKLIFKLSLITVGVLRAI